MMIVQMETPVVPGANQNDSRDLYQDSCTCAITDTRQLSPLDYNHEMADVIASLTPTPSRLARRAELRTQRWRADLAIALSALVAAMFALPLAQNIWHGPEVAATLAVAATAMLAGQRWAIALVVLAEMMLLPTIVPTALFGTSATSIFGVGALAQITAWLAIAGCVPGLLAMRRGAAAMVVVTGWRRTRRSVRGTAFGLVACGALAAIVPFL
jgi:hypothetical protein